MKILFLHQSIVFHDAIGNDIAHMYGLANVRHEAFVYGNYVTYPGLRVASKAVLEALIADEGNAVIYHHSQDWNEGEEILSRCRARILFKYHNVTPARFYRDYTLQAYRECQAGREMTDRLLARHPDAVWMADSTYNLQEVAGDGPDRGFVVPPFHAIERMRTMVPDRTTLKTLLESRSLNILTVGRVVPNKGHRFMLEVLRDYIDHYGPAVRLHVVGKRDREDRYANELKDTIDRLGIGKNVHFVGEIKDPVLLAFYLGCDLYLCASEHEGFCVPIIESQFCHLPVVARDAAAVAETLGTDQVLLGETVAEYSAALRLIAATDRYRDYLAEAGRRNYDSRFTNDVIADRFRHALLAGAGVEL